MRTELKDNIKCPSCECMNKAVLYFNSFEGTDFTIVNCGACDEPILLKIEYTSTIKVGRIDYDASTQVIDQIPDRR